MMGLSKKRIEQLIPSIEEFTELGDYLNFPVRVYSTGMRMRLTFAIATGHEPEILLIDEVFGAGDQQFFSKAEARMDKMLKKSNILVL